MQGVPRTRIAVAVGGSSLALGRIKQSVDYSQTINMTMVEQAMRAAPQFFADLRPVQ